MKKRTKNLLRLWGISFIVMIVTGAAALAVFLIAFMALIITQDATLPQP